MKHSSAGDLFTNIILESYKFTGLLTCKGDQISKTYGISSAKWKIISVLAHSDKQLTVTDVGHAMNQSRQAVQRIVNAMHKELLISFSQNPNHKRAKFISLTNKAIDIHTTLEEKQIPWANYLSNQIDENSLNITLKTIKELYQLIDHQESKE